MGDGPRDLQKCGILNFSPCTFSPNQYTQSMNNETFTVYVTTHALTKGILEFTARDCTEYSAHYYSLEEAGLCNTLFAAEKDAFKNRSDAVKDANKRAMKKIAALRKQITKLEGMIFE